MGNLITSLYCISTGVDLISNNVLVKNITANARSKLLTYGFDVDTSKVVFGKTKLKKNVLAEVRFVYKIPMCLILDHSWWGFDANMQENILVHELLHVYDKNIIDIAYVHQKKFNNLTFAEHIRNADSLTEIVTS